MKRLILYALAIYALVALYRDYVSKDKIEEQETIQYVYEDLPDNQVTSILDTMPNVIDKHTDSVMLVIANYAIRYNINEPEKFLSQVIVTTDTLRNKSYTVRNNLTGLSVAKFRPNTQLNKDGTVATYTDLKSFVIDYSIWLHEICGNRIDTITLQKFNLTDHEIRMIDDCNELSRNYINHFRTCSESFQNRLHQ